MLTVYYDGKCGLCAREIAFFQKRKASNPIRWNDVARAPETLAGSGLSQAEALMFMRVANNKGQFRGWRLLARLLQFPLLHPLASHLYRLFAKLRFRAYPHCRLAAEEASTTAHDLAEKG
ncbi:DUF393 domain-containing protein [Roseibium polysiphoniae]|uniref:DUF393 domain-containing protein n=1 Tax=Roseibium polysiphoniae TaxID=2571221 RepID=A0A944CEW6_9HYPH|nr:DUF393 domain-containing protein [Roseibium polysiphoniae]MBS8261809.1 DUF393 domain-containing protein [Roseibium polysiphoniae]